MIFVENNNDETLIHISLGSNYLDYYNTFKEVSPAPAFLSLLVRLKPVKAGEYIILANSSIFSILTKIWSSEFFKRALRIPEGYSNAQIFELTNTNAFLSGTIKEIPKEGTLIASTYQFHRGMDRGKLLKSINAYAMQMQEKLWTSRSFDYPLTREEWIILASLVEKEGLDYEDKAKIAGVILNRMYKKMPLQIDATILYIKTQGRYDQKITWDDIKLNKDKYKSRYNTYLYTGFPEGPITNPGVESMKAALNPMKSCYLYYRLVDGKHVFSENFAQHKKLL